MYDELKLLLEKCFWARLLFQKLVLINNKNLSFFFFFFFRKSAVNNRYSINAQWITIASKTHSERRTIVSVTHTKQQFFPLYSVNSVLLFQKCTVQSSCFRKGAIKFYRSRDRWACSYCFSKGYLVTEQQQQQQFNI